MKGLLLLSGGIDSPVAGYLMQQQCVDVIAVHFSSEPFTSDEPEKKCIEIAKLLGIKHLFVVYQSKSYSEFVKQCNHKYYYILMRRLMLRTAEAIAKKEQCDFLITGENIAQVASQTVSNMVSISSAVQITILRPVLCNDKIETINLAKKIGTYEISKGPELCCVLGPKHPATKSHVEVINREESKVDVKMMVEESLKTLKMYKL